MPAKRERLDTTSNKRYIRRDAHGRFTADQADVGRSSAADQRQRAPGSAKPGHGDDGDSKR